VRRGDDVIVEVPRDDLDKALLLIARHRQELQIRDWRETSKTPVGVLVIATLVWLVVVALAIALISSIATGKAKWGELIFVWLVISVVCAGFHIWVIRQNRRR
jgi:archaellum biogenesis protein FlaJ (TadC family)